jgi:hypothetical protein
MKTGYTHLGFSWVSLVPPDKCPDCISVTTWQLPSLCFPNNHSSIILTFDAILSSCWQRGKKITQRPYTWPHIWEKIYICTQRVLRGGRPGFGSQQYKIFLFFTASRPKVGPTQPPIQWVSRALSPRLKRTGSEADHSPPSSTEVKNGGAIPPLPHMSPWHNACLSMGTAISFFFLLIESIGHRLNGFP